MARNGSVKRNDFHWLGVREGEWFAESPPEPGIFRRGGKEWGCVAGNPKQSCSPKSLLLYQLQRTPQWHLGFNSWFLPPASPLWWLFPRRSPPHPYRSQWKSYSSSRFRFGPCLEYPNENTVFERSIFVVQDSILSHKAQFCNNLSNFALHEVKMFSTYLSTFHTWKK